MTARPGGPCLVLSLSPPARPHPFLWDQGHIEVLLWVPPRPPESHGFTVEPTSRWRMFLAAFRPQPARVIRIRGLPGRPTHWKRWPLTPAGAGAVEDYLDDLRLACRSGSVRYRALSWNCFHMAHRCLVVGGLDPPPLPGRLPFAFPGWGWRAFRRSVMADARHSSIAEELGGRRPS